MNASTYPEFRPVTSFPSHPSRQDTNRLTTPLGPPPPPLQLSLNPLSTNQGRKIPYAGAEHTLGPTFSEEEDGDDSEWIANKMVHLGLNRDPPLYRPAHAQARPLAHQPAQVQAQHHAQMQAQMQYEARVKVQFESNYSAQFQHQRAQNQKAALLHALYQQQPIFNEYQGNTGSYLPLQPPRYPTFAQPRPDIVPDYHTYNQDQSPDGREEWKRGNIEDKDIRALFENAPNANPKTQTPSNCAISTFETRVPFGEGWKSSTPPLTSTCSPPLPEPNRSNGQRFTTSGGDSLSTFLSRRRLGQEKPVENVVGTCDEKIKSQTGLGNGRPLNVLPGTRAQSLPVSNTPLSRNGPMGNSIKNRSISQGPLSSVLPSLNKVGIIRQPFGPPNEKELGEKNFQTRIRKRAGLNLGMLGRRTESLTTASANPV